MTQPAFPVVCDNCLESAADWYAVPTILFEVLTGRYPFVGTAMCAVSLPVSSWKGSWPASARSR